MSQPDPTRLKMTKDFGLNGIYFAVARAPESPRLFCGCSDFKVYELDVSAEKPQPVEFPGEGHQSYVTGVTLAGPSLVTGSYDCRLVWWDTVERTAQRTVDAHDRWIRRVIASPDGRLVASVADDMLCKLWDAESGNLVRTVTDHKPITPHHYPSMLYAVTFSSDGKLLATGDKVGHVAIWEVETGTKVGELETPVLYTWDPRQRRHSIGGIRSLAFSPDAKLLAVGGIGQIENIDHLGGPSRVEVFEWQAGKRLHELEDGTFKGLIEQIAFHPSGDWFVCAGGDNSGFVTFYDTQTGKLIKQEKAAMHIHAFAVNENFDTLYTVGHGRVAIWEFQGEDPKAEEKVSA